MQKSFNQPEINVYFVKKQLSFSKTIALNLQKHSFYPMKT